MANNEISIVPTDLRNAANAIKEQIAEPFAEDMKEYYNKSLLYLDKLYIFVSCYIINSKYSEELKNFYF